MRSIKGSEDAREPDRAWSCFWTRLATSRARTHPARSLGPEGARSALVGYQPSHVVWLRENSPAPRRECLKSESIIMSSFSIDETGESIAPKSSVSQQIKQSSVTGISQPKSDPTSIGEYFVVKDTPEHLEEALPFLRKGSVACHLRY